MKYAIWRHENSIGNSAEQVIGLYKHLVRNPDPNPEIYVEHEFQKIFALSIPFLKEEHIKFLDPEKCDTKNFPSDPFSKDIFIQNAYRSHMTYPGIWEDLSKNPDVTLSFPQRLYIPKRSYEQKIIVMQIREAGTFNHRIVGSNEEPERFVNPETFFELAEYYANKGYLVVRLGDKNQTPAPEHRNIIDLALMSDKTILDDLWFIDNSQLFISCDTGIWPMAGGMKKNLLLCNVMSVFGQLEIERSEKHHGVRYLMKKPSIVNWLPSKTATVMVKNPDPQTYHPVDNSLGEILEQAERFLS